MFSVHGSLGSRGARVLLLPVPFFQESGFAFSDISLIARRIDKRIGTTAGHLRVFRLQTEIGAVRPEEQIAGQTLENLERLDVVFRNLRIILIAHEDEARVYIWTAD